MTTDHIFLEMAPTGIADISEEDYGSGPLLRVLLSNGRVILIDAQHIDGQHEVQIGVYDSAPGAEPGMEIEDQQPIAGLAFNGSGPVTHHKS